MSLLIQGNLKMGPQVFLYNLPAKSTCTPTEWCLKGKNNKPRCYALRNNYLFPSVIKAAKERLKISKRKDFVDQMVEAIHKKNVNYFRLHSSGDFYNEEYVKKIIEISKQCPETLFRTTTRRHDLTDIILELDSLPNFIVRESLDTERQEPIMGLKFAALSQLPVAKDAFKCPGDGCEKCQHYCWKNKVDMCFKEK